MNTVGFNLIVGRGEEQLLDRCLKQVSKLDLDEIVVVVTHNDIVVKRTAEKYTDKVYYYEWFGFVGDEPINDFASARNFCMEHTESDYIMWLDTDDLISEVNINGFKEAIGHIRKNKHFLYYAVRYIVAFSNGNVPLESVKRVFCFKNRSEIKWLYKIHEGLSIRPNTPHAYFENIAIEHRPPNKKGHGDRNLKILEKLYKTERDSRIAFYYCKELYIEKMFKKAEEIQIQFVKDNEGGDEELAHVCLMLATYYTYKIDGIQTFNKETIAKGEIYAYLGLGFCDKYAEFDVILGDINDYKGNKDLAIQWYKKALDKKLNAVLAQDIRYYRLIPADRLSVLFFSVGDFESALLYNKMAIQSNYEKSRLLKIRKKILKRINNERVD